MRHQDKIRLLYSGDNDLSDAGSSIDEVLRDFRAVLQKIRAVHPKIPVHVISVKLSPGRQEFWPKMIEFNRKLRSLANAEKNLHFIDVTATMKDERGHVREDIFVEDQLHMTESGYDLWAKAVKSNFCEQALGR